MVFKFASSDGITASGTAIQTEITVPRFICDTVECRTAAQAVAVDGVDMLRLQVPPGLQNTTTPLSEFRQRLFMIERFSSPLLFPMRSPSADQPPCCEIAGVIETQLDCDPAGLKTFIPFGMLHRLSLTCRSRQLTHAKPGTDPLPSSDAEAAVEVLDNGSSIVTTPAGAFEVRNLRRTVTIPELNDQSVLDSAFSEEIGAAVRSHVVILHRTDGEWRAAFETEFELIAVR